MGLPPESDKFRQRPSRRVDTRIVFGGLGLLGVLVTVAILALLGYRVLSDVDERPRDAGALLEAAPGKGGVTAPGRDAATCDVARRTLETAVRAYEAMYGSLPPDEQSLVGDLLDGPIEQWDYRLVDGAPAYEGVGACEGR